MVDKLTTRIARLIAPQFISDLENKAKERDIEVNQRVAMLINDMDPYEPYMRRFKGVFSDEFDNPEDKLREADKMGMWMWGWKTDTDPHFKYLTDWIINTQANATIKRKAISGEEVLYCRAKITAAIQIRDEVRRLANLYRDYIERSREEEDEDGGNVTGDA